MFKRSFRSQDQTRVDKAARLKKNGSSREPTKITKLQKSLTTEKDQHQPQHAQHQHQHQHQHAQHQHAQHQHAQPQHAQRAQHQHQHHQASMPSHQPSNPQSTAPSPIVTLTVGREGRLFAAHEDVLRQSPFFTAACSENFFDAQNRRISLPDEEPEVFSAVLEYLYKGDYYPRLIHNRQRNSWELEDQPKTASRSPHPSPNPQAAGGRAAGASPEAAVYISSIGADILRDTVVYCAAERYGLDELKRLALRKQGLQAGIDVGTILRSAQYAYAHTPDSDSRLRAHYLALIIRCRKTFKRSGTMQAEMEAGGSKLFFDLFVAMCNHLDDVIEVSNVRTPKTV